MNRIKSLLIRSFRSFWVIFKIMLPVSIAVKILQEMGWLEPIGRALSPLMEWIGLPGETGIVWASAILSNLYGGMIALFNLNLSLSIAQLTVLSSLMLIAHNFPVELWVARKAGLKLFPQFLLRFGFALLFAWLLYHSYRLLGLYQFQPVVEKIFQMPEKETWWAWGLNELKNYGIIFMIISALTLLMELLETWGLMRKIEKALGPILAWMGIGKSVIPITIIGLSLGLAYGGALITEEAKRKEIPKKDIFYAFLMMALCHSIIEDSLLMISIGASITGVLIARIIFTLFFVWLLVRLTRGLNDTFFQKWILRS